MVLELVVVVVEFISTSCDQYSAPNKSEQQWSGPTGTRYVWPSLAYRLSDEPCRGGSETRPYLICR